MQSLDARFTGEARRAMIRSQVEAQRCGYGYILLDHLFLGLLRSPESNANAILRALGADPAALAEQVERALGPGDGLAIDDPVLSESIKAAINSAVKETRRLRETQVGTEHLLIGLISQGSGITNGLLRAAGITVEQVQAQMVSSPEQGPDSNESSADQPGLAPIVPPRAFIPKPPIKVSRVFIGAVVVTLIGADLAYLDQFLPNLATVGLLLFVSGGWIISLSLHEFGHALVAFIGGDESVARRGYLSLNPLKYTNIVLSILFPLVILLLGGIGLPGGAVYVNPQAIRSRGMRSLMSAAGPIASALCGLVFLMPFLLGMDPIDRTSHEVFWGGLTLLVFLQITAVLFNLLPFPGLDGFGILAPFLPEGVRVGIQRFGFFGLIFIFVLFMSNSPMSQLFWRQILYLSMHLGLDPYLILAGVQHLQFWSH